MGLYASGATAQESITLPPPAAAVPDTPATAYDLAKGGLKVAIRGTYPEGFAPKWAIASGDGVGLNVGIEDRNTSPATNRYGVMRALIADFNGQPVMVVTMNGLRCMADIGGVPAVLSATPTTFKLSNFRYITTDQAKCRDESAGAKRFSGSLTLAADDAGNLNMSLTVQGIGVIGLPSEIITTQNVVIPNDMTPATAVAQAEVRAEAQRQAALAEKARQEELARAQQAQIAPAQTARGGRVSTSSAGAPAPAPTGYTTFASDTGWTSFAYPQGWSAFPVERQPGRYLENYVAQPAGQDFTGQPGQVVLRIFDPMYVIEESAARSDTPPAVLFERFIRKVVPGGAGAHIDRLKAGGRSYFFASLTDQGVASEFVGWTSRNDYLDLVAIAAAPGDIANWRTTLLQVAASTSMPGPNRQSTLFEAAVRDWFAASQKVDIPAMRALSCQQVGLVNGLVTVFGDAMGVPRAKSKTVAETAAEEAHDNGIHFDFSQLRFQTLRSNDSLAAVRISGNVIQHDGTLVPYYQMDKLGVSSNVLAVRVENGEPKVCEPVRGGTQ